MPQKSRGAQNALKCMCIKDADRVVMITDEQTDHIAKSVQNELEKLRVVVLWLVIEQEIGQRPVKKFPHALQQKIRNFKPTVSYYIASGQEGELPAFRMPLVKFLTEELHCRHGHMIGINDQLMQEGMSVDYQQVRDTTMRVYDKVRKAKNIKVKAEGTNLQATFDPKLRWYAENGFIEKQGVWNNLPAGEVFTCPLSVEGIIAAYVIGDYLSKKYGVLESPLLIKVKDSRVVAVSCQNPQLANEFEQYIREHKNGDRVGEFAIGTLVGLKLFTGNLLQDEKFPGIHVAFGGSYPEKTGATWDCPTHIDVLPRGCSIWVDKQLIMHKGAFILHKK